MSSPSAGRYRVVSPEELERRKLAAAKDRFGRAAEALRNFRAELAGACAAYGPMADVHSPRVSEPTRASGSEEWERAAEEMTRQLDLANSALADGIARSRVSLFMRRAEGISGSLTEDRGAPELRGQPQDGDQVAKHLGRLPADSSPHALSRCESLAQQWSQANRGAERQRVLDALRLVVQQECDRAEMIDSNRRRIEALYRDLDGLRGEAVERVRGLLKGTALDRPIPADLEERVRQVSEDACAEEDRRFVLETVAGIFSKLGYEVDDQFGTVVPEEGLLLELPGSRAHGLLVRERGHQLLLNVFRHGEAGPRDARSDTAAEEHFCRDLPRLQEALVGSGVELQMERLDPPGTIPVQVIQAPHKTARRQRRAKPSERARKQP
jgi:hypothetical protein